MAKVYFAPMCAVKYTGAKPKEFVHSLARPKPVLRRGDIVILDKKTAFNLTTKGYDEYVYVDAIEFVKADSIHAGELNEALADALDRNAALSAEHAAMMVLVDELQRDNEVLLANIAELELQVQTLTMQLYPLDQPDVSAYSSEIASVAIDVGASVQENTVSDVDVTTTDLEAGSTTKG